LLAKYNYSDQAKEDEIAGHVAHMREECIWSFVGKTRRRPLGTPRRRREDNIKTDVTEIG
jgi:hypothetical protein